MHAVKGNSASLQSEQVADPADRRASKLVSTWAQARRRNTPWAYGHLRTIAAVRLVVGAYLVVVGAVLVAYGHSGWAVIPLLGAALTGAIGGLDMTVAHSARPRS